MRGKISCGSKLSLRLFHLLCHLDSKVEGETDQKEFLEE